MPNRQVDRPRSRQLSRNHIETRCDWTLSRVTIKWIAYLSKTAPTDTSKPAFLPSSYSIRTVEFSRCRSLILRFAGVAGHTLVLDGSYQASVIAAAVLPAPACLAHDQLLHSVTAASARDPQLWPSNVLMGFIHPQVHFTEALVTSGTEELDRFTGPQRKGGCADDRMITAEAGAVNWNIVAC